MDFEERFKMAEAQYTNQGYPMNEAMRQNIREAIWNEYVDDIIHEQKI